MLYDCGFVLMVSGAVVAWIAARNRLRVLAPLDARVRANCDRQHELARHIVLIEPSADEQKRNVSAQAEQEALEAQQAQVLQATGLRRRGTPI